MESTIFFAGEASTTDGPETTGTYVWMETDNWQRWEEKLMFGPSTFTIWVYAMEIIFLF